MTRAPGSSGNGCDWTHLSGCSWSSWCSATPPTTPASARGARSSTTSALAPERTAPTSAPLLGKLFEILNTPEGERPRVLDVDLGALPCINGGLFAEPIPMPDFDRTLRAAL